MDDRSGASDVEPAQAVTLNPILPTTMARRAEETGVKRVATDPLTFFTLSVLAGVFISFGAIFATTVMAGSVAMSSPDGSPAGYATLPYGIVRLLAGVAFSLGFILVVIGGAELFTGNNLIVMAWAGGKVRTRDLLKSWGVAFVGNSVGALLTAVLVFYSTQYTFGKGAIGLAALTTANAKSSLAFIPALALGILCNALVCLAAWMCYGARTSIDRIFTYSADRGLCRRRFRAQHCKCLFYIHRLVHKGGSTKLILVRDRKDIGGFSRFDLEQFLDRQSAPRHDWQHHRRLVNGSRCLLVHLFAEEAPLTMASRREPQLLAVYNPLPWFSSPATPPNPGLSAR
jgi:formate/nitrite transporter FocA (FNT family)